MPSDHAFGDYLRARREVTQPGDVGLTVGPGMRRVLGLRRTEVAQLAGISAEYYVKLEQGRERRPTDQVLDALSRAFGLDPAARSYLHALARRSDSMIIKNSSPALEHARWLIDSWPHTAAMIHERHLDIVASNHLMRALVPAYRAQANSLSALLLDPDVRTFYRDWDGLTMRSVALWRAMTADYPNDVRSMQLVAQLSRHSERFRELWNRHDVGSLTGGVHEVDHPTAGPLALHFTSLPLSGGTGHMLFLYYAEPGTPTDDALKALAAGR